MTTEKQIQRWLESGAVTEKQAHNMLADIRKEGKKERKGRWIAAISVIGAILIGVGAILFVASNWEEIPKIARVLILFGSTFGAYYLGYLFKYAKKNLPKIGASLMFLGALLFGASIFLVSQIYNVEANAHWLVLVWLISVLPLVYALNSGPLAALSAILFLVWICLQSDNGRFGFDIEGLPAIYLPPAILLLGIGGLHYFRPQLIKIAGIFRIAGFAVSMLVLFSLTFDDFLEEFHASEISSYMISVFAAFSILSVIILAINLFFNPSRSKTNLHENGMALGVFGFALLSFFFPTESDVYLVLYNLLFAGLAIFLIYIGYLKSEAKTANIGIFWLSVFLIAKYFDFFWDLLEKSLFFAVGGIILLLGAAAMERKRKQIEKDFIKLNA